MTEMGRSIHNKEILDLCDEQVARVESLLGRLDRFEEDRYAANENIQRLNAENERIRQNEESLEKAKRVSKLRDNVAQLDLEKGDAEKIERNIASTKSRLLSIGRDALSSIAEIVSSLVSSRRDYAQEAIEELLDLSQVGAFGETLASNARCVIELRELELYFSHRFAANEPDYQVFNLRSLRERFSELRALVDSEPELILVMPTMAPSEQMPVVEPKPATMSSALVAA